MAHDRRGFYALSVFAKAREFGQSVDDVVRELAQRGGIRNAQVRITTAGRLRARGFALVRTGSSPLHYSVLPGSPDLALIARFVDVLEPPRKKPT